MILNNFEILTCVINIKPKLCKDINKYISFNIQLGIFEQNISVCEKSNKKYEKVRCC